MTFSVLARDPATGRLGLAVTSCVLAIGSRACRAVHGVGVVSVQGGGWAQDADVALSALRQRAGPDSALADLRAVGRPDAQYAVLAPSGASAWTGPAATAWAGATVRGDVVGHGNTLVGERVVAALVEGYRAREGPLEERLLAALTAGVAAGGDLRGQQSAALLSVGGGDEDEALVDLRVDDAREPVAELSRLLLLTRAHQLLQQAWPAAAHDLAGAAVLLRRARELAPDDVLVAQCAAAVLAQRGEAESARSAWQVACHRLPDPAVRLAAWRDLPWLGAPALALLTSWSTA